MTITDESVLRFLVGLFGALTALTQILVSLTKIKDETKLRWAGLTRMGWVFYGCTIFLGALPSIQGLIQDGIDRRNRSENQRLADSSEARIKREYEKSLLLMKAEFDKSSSNLTEILAKYGYKLDSANNSLIKLSDSPRVGINPSPIPILRLIEQGSGISSIRIGERLADGKTRVFLTFTSRMESSGNFYLKHSFVEANRMGLMYLPASSPYPLDSTYIIDRDGTMTSNENIALSPIAKSLFYWVRGSYTRADGTGFFQINSLYRYDRDSVLTYSIKGDTRKKVVDFINLWEK